MYMKVTIIATVATALPVSHLTAGSTVSYIAGIAWRDKSYDIN